MFPASPHHPATAATGQTAATTAGASAAYPHDEDLIACVVENRGRTVAISTMSPAHTHLLQTYIVQDSQSYAETLDVLMELRPREILLHDSGRKKPLATEIQSLVRTFLTAGASTAAAAASRNGGTAPPQAAAAAPSACVFVSRNYFDQDRGAELLRRLSVDALDESMLDSYVFLASAHCLLRYIEATCSVRFPPGCLKISLGYGQGGRLLIDRATAKDLELVANVRTGSQKKGSSLFGVINKTKTETGAKMLKANLLAPLTDCVTITARHDFVELLLASDPGTVEGIQALLVGLGNLDAMLGGVATVDAKEDVASARRQIATVILLKSFLRRLPPLVDALEQLLPADGGGDLQEGEEGGGGGGGGGSNTDALLRALIAAFSPPCFAELRARIDEVIAESTTHERGARTRRLQECFAVNPGFSGLLDVARKTFLQSVEDIYELANGLSREHGLPDLRVAYSAGRGYYLTLPATGVGSLPPVFIQATVVKKALQCTTEEIASLSRATDESAAQCVLLTCQVLRDELLEGVRAHMDSLLKAVEAISLLDMLTAFTELVLGEDRYWVRPTLSADPDCALAIKAGRHPVVEKHVAAFTPNSAFASRFSNFVLVSGANGCGKSVFVKAVCLTVVLAQIGCFVPCESATLPIRDRLLTSLSTGDDLETGLSSFMAEMRRAAYILEHLTPRALVTIDELGRSTATTDGASLSYAVAEALLPHPCLAFFVSHYRQLRPLARAYGNVRQVHLASTITAGGRGLVFHHRVEEGPSDLASGYGIALAGHCGFPEAVLNEAERIKRLLERKGRGAGAGQGGGGGSGQEREPEGASPAWQYAVMQRLMMLKGCLDPDSSNPKTPAEVRTFLHRLRATLVPAEVEVEAEAEAEAEETAEATAGQEDGQEDVEGGMDVARAEGDGDGDDDGGGNGEMEEDEFGH